MISGSLDIWHNTVDKLSEVKYIKVVICKNEKEKKKSYKSNVSTSSL